MTLIAMTREIGSLGTEVAGRVAKQLGLEIVRSEVAANNVARRLGVAESAISRYLDGSASLLERWQIDRRKLFHYASEEILSLAQRGNVLVKGWGAATMLRDVPQVINVRACAPMEFRVRVMMERQGRNDAPTVQEEIERFDAARARTLRAYFNVEQEDARLYHIVLNTERLSVDACVDAVCKLAEGPQFRDTFECALRSPTSSWRPRSARHSSIISGSPWRHWACPSRSPTAGSRLPARPAAGACGGRRRRSRTPALACCKSTTASSACQPAEACFKASGVPLPGEDGTCLLDPEFLDDRLLSIRQRPQLRNHCGFVLDRGGMVGICSL